MKGLFGPTMTSHWLSPSLPGTQGLQSSPQDSNLGASVGRHSIPSEKRLQSYNILKAIFCC